jgi:uncharacterized membrane protein
MALLILGLALFIGVHSIRIVAPAWRDAQVARMGNAWKGIYSVLSIAGFVVLVWGFGIARHDPVSLYAPPTWLKHANAVFTLVAFILFSAAYIPRNHFKSSLGHPMYGGVKVWAVGHLLATGMLHDVVLFGAFLAWSIAGFMASRRRDRANGTTYPAGTAMSDVLAVVIGAAAWFAFAAWLHPRWIGVPAFA